MYSSYSPEDFHQEEDVYSKGMALVLEMQRVLKIFYNP